MVQSDGGRVDPGSEARIAIVGAGPAGLIAAERLSAAGRPVAVFDRMPSPARKFLMAGRGGLNLTHSEPLDAFLSRYRPQAPALLEAVRAFPPAALRDFVHSLGQPTIVGSSGRVFPQSFKASPLLRALLARLAARGVSLHPRHAWEGWTESGALRFSTPEGPRTVVPAATVFALGGASWPRLGSDGGWAPLFAARGVEMTPFAPANMGIEMSWSDHVAQRFAGAPLKRIALGCGPIAARGEAVITPRGLEGGAVYAIAAVVREEIARTGRAVLTLDLRPDLDAATLAARLAAVPQKQSLASRLRKGAGLSPAAAAMLREGLPFATSPEGLAAAIKRVRLDCHGVAGLDRAISSAGGIAFSALGPDFELAALPGTFVCGEMLDWEAPTGGYLLQGCFATGWAAAGGLMSRAVR